MPEIFKMFYVCGNCGQDVVLESDSSNLISPSGQPIMAGSNAAVNLTKCPNCNQNKLRNAVPVDLERIMKKDISKLKTTRISAAQI